MKTTGIGLAACAALAVAGCATHQATPTHRMSVDIVGAESADCVSPQAVGEYAITAPGDFIVEPEAPSVVVICNAEGYQETYASFDEVYNDGSAGTIALGALAFGIMGAAITAGSDGLDSLPNRVTITMVPEGEVHDGSLAQGEYEKASETVIATASLAPAYTAAEPPEDSEIAMARAKALASGDQVAAAQARDAELRQFETRLRGNQAQLIRALNDYNGDVEFARSPYSGKPHKVKSVARVTALEERQGNYVVEMQVTSGFANSNSHEVFDQAFLVNGKHGGLRILAHGQQLTDKREQFQTAALAGSEDMADIERFEARLQANEPQLVRLLNDYNRKTDFKKSSHTNVRLNIRDVGSVNVLEKRDDGYLVRIVGNSSVSASWSYEVYDELFLIDGRRGGLRIMAHGKRLATQDS